MKTLGTFEDYLGDFLKAMRLYQENPSSMNFEDMWSAKKALERHFPEKCREYLTKDQFSV